MSKIINLDFCPICGAYLETIATYYRDHPFIDGRKYKEMCHCCFSVPKMSEYDEKEQKLIVYDTWDARRLNTPEDLMSDGFSKINAQKSVKAVRASIKRFLKTDK